MQHKREHTVKLREDGSSQAGHDSDHRDTDSAVLQQP